VENGACVKPLFLLFTAELYYERLDNFARM
jgi:hypothetical protein